MSKGLIKALIAQLQMVFVLMLQKSLIAEE